MIQTELTCPQCGSPHQKGLDSHRYQCASCLTVWFEEDPSVPAEDQSPAAQVEPVMVVKPASILAGEYLQAEGYLTGQQVPHQGLGNWWYLDIFEAQPSKTVSGFLGRVKLVEQDPRRIGRLEFNQFEEDPNHWVLRYYGESRTQKITTLAHGMADNLGVKIYVILERK